MKQSKKIAEETATTNKSSVTINKKKGGNHIMREYLEQVKRNLNRRFYNTYKKTGRYQPRIHNLEETYHYLLQVRTKEQITKAAIAYYAQTNLEDDLTKHLYKEQDKNRAYGTDPDYHPSEEPKEKQQANKAKQDKQQEFKEHRTQEQYTNKIITKALFKQKLEEAQQEGQ